MFMRIIFSIKKIFFLLFIFLFYLVLASCSSNSDPDSNTEKSLLPDKQIKWLSYEQALIKSQIENIPTMLYFYSEDCTWCRKMESETFANQEVQKVMYNDFALAKINGNSNQKVIVEGEKITERQLSTEIFQVRGFPTIWFLSSDNTKIASLPGFVTTEIFLDILTYIRDGFYQKYTFPEYRELLKAHS